MQIIERLRSKSGYCSQAGTEPGFFFRVFLKYNKFYLSPVEQQNVPVMEASDGDNPHDTWSIVVHQTARVTAWTINPSYC